MNELGVWDTYSVKAQTLKTAIEVTYFSSRHPRSKCVNLNIILTSLEDIICRLSVKEVLLVRFVIKK